MSSIPETSPCPWPITRIGIKITVWGVITGLAVRGSHYVFTNHSPPAPLAILMILATAALMLVCIAYLCRWHLALDEMQQRIQLLSLAWVGPGMMLIAIFAEMLRWAGLVSPITWNVRAIGVVFLASYCVALAWFWRRNHESCVR